MAPTVKRVYLGGTGSGERRPGSAYNTWLIGDAVYVNVQWENLHDYSHSSGRLLVFGLPKINLGDIGSDGNDKYAVLSSVNDDTVSFKYTVQEGDALTSDSPNSYLLEYKNVNALDLNSGTILGRKADETQTAASDAVNDTFPALSATGSLSVSQIEEFVMNTTRPTVTITGTGASSSFSDGDKANSAVFLKFTTSVSGTDFGAEHVSYSGGTLRDFESLGPDLDGKGVYTAKFSPPSSSRSAYVSVAANAFKKTGENGNTASAQFDVEWDLDAPTMAITAKKGDGSNTAIDNNTTTNDSVIDLTFTSNESTSNFALGDISVAPAASANITDFIAVSDSTTTYTAKLTVTADATYTINVATGAFTDAAGNGNTAAPTFTWARDKTGPSITGLSMDGDNTQVTVTLSEGAYANANQTGALTVSDFTLSLSGGTATLPSARPTSISTNAEGDPGEETGGTIFVLGFTTTGTADGSETLTVNAAEDAIFDQYGNTASKTQSSGNTVSLNDKRVSAAIGDPYVYPLLSKTPVKLPNKNAIYRLYECDDTFINAEVLENTPEHIERILSSMPKGIKSTFDIDNGYYFSKFYIKEGENYLNIDLRKKVWTGHMETHSFFNLDLDEDYKKDGHDFWYGNCKTLTINWNNKENKNVTVKVLFFQNPFIENGIKIEVEDLNKKAIGMCVRNYKPKLMQLKNIKQTKYEKLHKNINKRSPYQFKQIKEKEELWIKQKGNKWTSI